MEEDVKKIVAKNLINLRKSLNLTQADVAKKLNYSDKSISKWEHADSLPDISILYELSEMYGVTVDYLVHDNPEEQLKFTKSKIDSSSIIVIALAVTSIYLIATIAFIYSTLNGSSPFWQAFVWGLPVCFVCMLYYNRRYIKVKGLKSILTSMLLWSLLASVFLQFGEYKLWMVFILGVPIQIIILLIARLEKTKKY